MIVSINQPAYLPWLGYFERIAVSDLHIVLDHVQFEKNSFINRNKIRTAEGWCWLTVPVKTKGRFGQLSIQSLEIDESSNWREKHWRTIQQNYSKAPFWKDYQVMLESIYGRPWNLLNDLCREMTNGFLQALGIRTPLRFSTEMQPSGTKDDLILNLCRHVKSDTYLSGALGRNYLNEDKFREAKIRSTYQDYHHPQYIQEGRKGFEPYMGVIDLILNCGPQSLDILTEGQPKL